MDWSEYTLSSIIGGVSADGTKFLKLFLQDVVNVLNVKQPNASCNKCLTDYYNQLTQGKIKKEMESKNYLLHKKYEGIPLKFGSNVHVTNSNITDEYAKVLIERFKEVNPEFTESILFEKFPKEELKEVKPNKQKNKSNDKGNI